jgi:UDP-2,3-diacylglucosamine hydrolase
LRQKQALALDLTHSTVFLADVHLGRSQEVSDRFSAFLDKLDPSTTIISLGDLVEVWAEGSDWDIADRYPILDRLRDRLVFYLPGNRDFLMGERWRARFHGRILPDPSEFRIGGRRILVTHGDLLLTGDYRYRLWRVLCRSRTFKHVTGQLGPDRALRMAGGLRKESEKEIARKSDATLALDRREAERRLGDRNLLVAGHVHRAERSPLGQGELIVLGAWDAGGEILHAKGDDLWFGRPEELL